MEIDLDLQENAWITWLAAAVIIALALVGLAFIGRNATPLDVATGEPRVIEWSDWQVLQARREHNRELAVLREDLTAIALMFQQPPDPVAAQILQARISQHTRNGQPTLELARAHLQNAADGLAAWSSSQMEREELIALIQQSESALK
jgi:hypothetical protein